VLVAIDDCMLYAFKDSSHFSSQLFYSAYPAMLARPIHHTSIHLRVGCFGCFLFNSLLLFTACGMHPYVYSMVYMNAVTFADRVVLCFTMMSHDYMVHVHRCHTMA